jgi:hypothetical protein
MAKSKRSNNVEKRSEDLPPKVIPADAADTVVGGESPKETVTFEYGSMQVVYSQQNANGLMPKK